MISGIPEWMTGSWCHPPSLPSAFVLCIITSSESGDLGTWRTENPSTSREWSSSTTSSRHSSASGSGWKQQSSGSAENTIGFVSRLITVTQRMASWRPTWPGGISFQNLWISLTLSFSLPERSSLICLLFMLFTIASCHLLLGLESGLLVEGTQPSVDS